MALFFSLNETFFIIRIESNNNPPGFYCYNITDFSQYSKERTILITSNCVFEVTNIEKNKKKKQIQKEEIERHSIIYDFIYDDDNEEISCVVYLTCLGNVMNYKNY